MYFEKNGYSELPVIGFMLDGKSTGFKTPVLQNGGEPAIQDANKDGIVTGFVNCREDDLLRIYRSNWPIAVKSRVGQEVVFLFKTEDDILANQRSRLIPRLLVEMRQYGSMSPTDAINVMIFARLPYSRIEAAIDQFVLEMEARGLGSMGPWAISFKKRVKAKLSESSESQKSEVLGLVENSQSSRPIESRVDIAVLEERAEREIQQVSELEEKESALRTFDLYYQVKNSLSSRSKEIKEIGLRDLFLLSSTVDAHGLQHLSFLVNSIFVENCWRNFLSWNGSRYGRKIKTTEPYGYIASAAKIDLSERLTAIAEVFGHFRPFSLKDKLGVERNLPTQLVLRGEVVSRSDNGNVFVRVGRKLVEIEKDQCSIALHNAMNPVGQHILFQIRSSNLGTCKGDEFVSSVLEMFFPSKLDAENPIELFIGASLSWVVLRTSGTKYNRLISGGGIYLEQIKELCGLRRLTVIRKSSMEHAEVLEFCRVAWRELNVEIDADGSYLLSLEASGEVGLLDERKLRTFKSMFKKVFPGAKMSFRFRGGSSEEWLNDLK